MDLVEIYKNPNCELFKNSKIGFLNDSYIVSLNNQIIGHFNLLFGVFNENSIVISYELLESFRNLKIGNEFYKIIENYIYKHFSFEELVLIIHFKNIKSIKIALKNGYTINYDYVEKNEELTNYNPYVKKFNKLNLI